MLKTNQTKCDCATTIVNGERIHDLTCSLFDGVPMNKPITAEVMTATLKGEDTRPIYWIEKTFIGGVLKGMKWDGHTHTKYDVGFVCEKPVGNTSPYRITACFQVA